MSQTDVDFRFEKGEKSWIQLAVIDVLGFGMVRDTKSGCPLSLVGEPCQEPSIRDACRRCACRKWSGPVFIVGDRIQIPSINPETFLWTMEIDRSHILPH